MGYPICDRCGGRIPRRGEIFPIWEEGWRKIVAKIKGEAQHAKEVFGRRYEHIDIPDDQIDVWMAGVFEGKMDALGEVAKFFYWWEHERGEEGEDGPQ